MSVGQFIVNPDDLRTLVSGLAGVVGDLYEIGGVIRTGDAGSAGDSRLVESIANFQSIWSTGVTDSTSRWWTSAIVSRAPPTRTVLPMPTSAPGSDRDQQRTAEHSRRPERRRRPRPALSDAASRVGLIQSAVAANGLDSWTGTSANAFRDKLSSFQPPLAHVGSALGRVGSELAAFASALVAHQEDRNYQQGQIESSQSELSAARARTGRGGDQQKRGERQASTGDGPASARTCKQPLGGCGQPVRHGN